MAVATEQRTEVRAQAKWVRTSPQKARLVLDLIRGRSVPEARAVLAFSTRAIAVEVEKVLRSAVANAENNFGLNGNELYVSACYADDGPRLKRWRARARGSAARIVKPMCHITIKLATMDDQRAVRSKGPGMTTVAATAAVPETAPSRSRARKAAQADVEEPTPSELETPGAEPAPESSAEAAVEEKPKTRRAAKPKADAPAEKPAAKKSAAKKPAAKKPAAEKPAAKKDTTPDDKPKKTTARKSTPKKTEEK
jgi:large subunit ribosomal protein L22